MEKKIKSFGEFLHGRIDEAEENELIDEGWKEILVAGALALVPLKGKSQDIAKGDPQKNRQATVATAKSNEKVTVDFGTDFLSGRYKISDKNTEETEQKLKQIAEFVKNHQSANIIITINAGESQVPNKDFEAGKQSNGDYKRMPVGALANNRAEVMKDIVGTFMMGLDKQGVFKGAYDIRTGKPVIGTTPYKPGEDPHQDKFTAEQFVNVTVEAEGGAKPSSTVNFSAYAKDGEMIYIPAGPVSNIAIGEIRKTLRDTRDIKDNGLKDGGYQDLLLQEIDKLGKLTGKSYMIPWQWWNKVVGQGHYLSAEQWQHIQDNFEVK